MSQVRPLGHQPELLRRADGRWEVRCPQCQQAEMAPVGISLPIVNRAEAESILQNHTELRSVQPGR